MILDTVKDRIGKVCEEKDCLELRYTLCQYRANEAFFTHHVGYGRLKGWRQSLHEAKSLITVKAWSLAQDVIDNIECQLDKIDPTWFVRAADHHPRMDEYDLIEQDSTITA